MLRPLFALFLFAAVLAAQSPDRAVRLRDATLATCGWGTAKDDRSVDGMPLAVAGIEADRGIGTHAPAELVFAVPKNQRWFTCWFGVAAERGTNGSIELIAFADGVEGARSTVQKGGDAPQWLCCEVTGRTELRLVVRDAGDGNGADHCNLLWPTFVGHEVRPEARMPRAIAFEGSAQLPSGLAVWSDRPASQFVESHPIGDGRLGASGFGGVAKDRVVLNEISMWSGSVDDAADRQGASANLPKIRELLAKGDHEAAEKLVNHLMRPEVQLATLRSTNFFPTVNVAIPADMPASVRITADAIARQSGAPDANPGLLPVGLGALGGKFNQVYVDTFERIVLANQPVRAVLDQQAATLRALMLEANAPCWEPDKPSVGACPVK